MRYLIGETNKDETERFFVVLADALHSSAWQNPYRAAWRLKQSFRVIRRRMPQTKHFAHRMTSQLLEKMYLLNTKLGFRTLETQIPD